MEESNSGQQARILVFSALQKLMEQDENGRWFLDFDKEDIIFDDLTDYVCDNPASAMEVVCIALQCAAIWFGELVDGDPRDILLTNSIGLLNPAG
jgi:hypothetical protein